MKKSREIETFELSPEYYVSTFQNGNKTHCAEELGELLLCNLMSCLNIVTELPKDIREFILNNKHFNYNVNILHNMAQIGIEEERSIEDKIAYYLNHKK